MDIDEAKARMTRVIIPMDRDMVDRLDSRAREAGWSRSAMVRDAVQGRLDELARVDLERRMRQGYLAEREAALKFARCTEHLTAEATEALDEEES